MQNFGKETESFRVTSRDRTIYSETDELAYSTAISRSQLKTEKRTFDRCLERP